MIGRLFNTLRFRLEAEEKEWRSLNELRKELQPAPWQRCLVQMAGSPLSWCLSIFGLVSLLALAAALIESKYWVVIDVCEFEVQDQIAYFSGLWSVQTSIVALVYPIVIAFVTLLVGRAGSTRAALHVYLHDSTSLMAGLSALLLVAEMGLQYFWIPYVDKTTLMNWIGLDAVWFAFNIGLTIYFLFRTFEFMQPARRFEITHRYAINFAWPREARFHLAKHIFTSAVEGNLLPGPSYGTAKEGEPSVLAGFRGLDSGVAAVKREQNDRKQLLDIRFRLLAWVTSRWLKRAKILSLQMPKEVRGTSDALLSFPLVPFDSYEGNAPICRIEGGVTLTSLEKLVVRLSFVFGTWNDESIKITANDILEDAQAVAIDALRTGEVEAFKDALNQMLDLYKSLLEASQIKDINGRPANFAQLSDRNHWFEEPVYKVWSRRFVDLYEIATSKLSISDDYVRFLAHVPNRMFGAAQDSAAPEIAEHAILLSPILLRRLEDWWVQTVEQQGQVEHSPCNPAFLRPPFQGVHDKALREIISSWESLKNDRILPRDEDRASWSVLQQSARHFEAHLSHTLLSLFDCVLRGDQNAAEWLTDILMKWHSQLQFRFNEVHNFFLRKQHLITIELMSKEWTEVEQHIHLESYGVSGTINPLAVLAACLNNLWKDTCCVAIYILTIWARECNCGKSLPAMIATELVSGNSPKKGGRVVCDDKPFDSVDDLLMSLLRQYFADGKYKTGYRKRLDKYVERIAELAKSEMIPGRIYSSFGADDLDSVSDGQLLVLLLVFTKNWKPGHDIVDLIKDWAGTADYKAREFKRLLDAWKTRLNEPSFVETKEAYDCLTSRLTAGANPDFEEARANVNQAIEQLIFLLNEVRVEALVSASPSARRLNEISRWASATGFAKETAAFPLPLFDTITYVAELLPEQSLVIKGIRKGELTDPLMDDTATNESDWFSHTMREYVAAFTLNSTISQINPEIVSVTTPEAYWARIQRFARDMRQDGLHPILILESPTIPEWIWDWAHPPFDGTNGDIPDNLIVSRNSEESAPGYQWSFNDIPVFNAPIPPGASILTVREAFERIEFTIFPEGSFVKTNTTAVDGHPELVDLIFSWHVRVGVKLFPSVRLSYNKVTQRRRPHARS